MQKYHRNVVNKVTTPQTKKARSDQVKNDAGGYGFRITRLHQLRKFLIVGSATGTYYVTAKKAIRDSEENIIETLKQHGIEAVNLIVEVSDRGLALKNDEALFALAIAAGHPEMPVDVRRAALYALPQVARIPTHLSIFMEYIKNYRGFGATLKRAVQNWFLIRDANKLAYQTVKYRSREGWKPMDFLRKAHPQFEDPIRDAIARYLVGAKLGPRVVKRHEVNNKKFHRVDRYPDLRKITLPPIIEGYEEARMATTPNQIIPLITEYGLTHEMVPNELLNEAGVWEALLQKMPPHAMIRNLNKMTAVGVFNNRSNVQLVKDRLTDPDQLKKSRVHPIAILIATKIYARGYGDQGDLRWNAHSQIANTLDRAFYAAFAAVEPINKPMLIALDISGSMFTNACSTRCIDSMEASAAMALVTVATEPEGNVDVVGFQTQLTQLDINPRRRLDDILKYLRDKWTGGGTDCALPMLYAADKKLDYDTFAIYTDGDTWAGRPHPHQALQRYRRERNERAKMVVCSTTARSISIADPTDAGMWDICGFSADTPQLISMYARGDF